jgi:methylthioribose-1-phosphate isomerase
MQWERVQQQVRVLMKRADRIIRLRGECLVTDTTMNTSIPAAAAAAAAAAAFGASHVAQEINFKRWQDALPQGARVAIVEIGAGKTIPTVRHRAEIAAKRYGTCRSLVESQHKSGSSIRIWSASTTTMKT